MTGESGESSGLAHGDYHIVVGAVTSVSRFRSSKTYCLSTCWSGRATTNTCSNGLVSDSTSIGKAATVAGGGLALSTNRSRRINSETSGFSPPLSYSNAIRKFRPDCGHLFSQRPRFRMSVV